MADGLRLAVRLTPKAGRDGIEGLKPTADGGVELSVKVTAVPENGKANDALLRLLAKRLKLPVSSLQLVAGTTDRHKQILIGGDPSALETALRAAFLFSKE
ncbi:DUF167 family protein [Ferrovibrio sp.]|uniref:DUF167 family protein n=1 Tax=Ferrovibrio sp. TaxID=1917215 RepID=UPI00345C05AC